MPRSIRRARNDFRNAVFYGIATYLQVVGLETTLQERRGSRYTVRELCMLLALLQSEYSSCYIYSNCCQLVVSWVRGVKCCTSSEIASFMCVGDDEHTVDWLCDAATLALSRVNSGQDATKTCLYESLPFLRSKSVENSVAAYEK